MAQGPETQSNISIPSVMQTNVQFKQWAAPASARRVILKSH